MFWSLKLMNHQKLFDFLIWVTMMRFMEKDVRVFECDQHSTGRATGKSQIMLKAT